jgi:hypothetical protein
MARGGLHMHGRWTHSKHEERPADGDSAIVDWITSLVVALAWVAVVFVLVSQRGLPATLADQPLTSPRGDDLAATINSYVVDVQVVADGWLSS